MLQYIRLAGHAASATCCLAANIFVDAMSQTGLLPLPVVGFIGGLHSSTEVLQVKPHDVIQPIHAPQPGVQPIPCYLHLLPVQTSQLFATSMLVLSRSKKPQLASSSINGKLSMVGYCNRKKLFGLLACCLNNLFPL